MTLTFFATPQAFRRWLKANHRTANELWVGFYKKATGLPTITWSEAVDEALCFGWIDGVRKAVDEISYTNRFTPRRSKSHWSAVNIARVKVLEETGRMTPAGQEAFEKRVTKKTGVYSYEQRRDAKLTRAMERVFRRNAAAWKFFQELPTGLRQLLVFHVMDAKQEATRERRLQRAIRTCAAGHRPDPMGPASKYEQRGRQ